MLRWHLEDSQKVVSLPSLVVEVVDFSGKSKLQYLCAQANPQMSGAWLSNSV